MPVPARDRRNAYVGNDRLLSHVENGNKALQRLPIIGYRNSPQANTPSSSARKPQP